VGTDTDAVYELEVSYTDDDFSEYRRWVASRRFGRDAIFVAAGVALVALVLSEVIAGRELPLLVTAVVFLATCWLQWAMSMKRRAHVSLKPSASYHLTVDPSAVEWETGAFASRRTWSRVRSVAANELQVLVFTDRDQVVLFPRRVFASDDAWATFVDDVCEWFAAAE
jgi:hypothetical protein